MLGAVAQTNNKSLKTQLFVTRRAQLDEVLVSDSPVNGEETVLIVKN